ncbi:MAG: glycosyltransferase [Campylobacterota bacterium]|nr:glycosyltransferase [Campylobacterota bacterium]
MKKTKILFFIHQLNSGGAQKVILNLVSHLNKEKFEVILVVINNIGEYSNFSHSDVKLIDLKIKHIRNSIFKIIKTVKEEKPEIVFSGLSYLSLIISFIIPFLRIKSNIKFIARESSILSIDNADKKFTKILNLLYKLFYKRFDLIVCQSMYMQNDLIKNYKISKNKTVVINNPIVLENIYDKLNILQCEKLYAENTINLLAIGRLHKVKGFDMLLESVSRLNHNYHLTILGAGLELKSLQNLAKNLKIEDRVHFLGFKHNPYIYMKQADLFVLSSRHEGFPNVVLEANACGLPVVAFECPGGIKEILVNGLNGYLVENGNINELSDTIVSSSNYQWDRNKIINKVKNTYNVNLIIDKYEKLL